MLWKVILVFCALPSFGGPLRGREIGSQTSSVYAPAPDQRGTVLVFVSARCPCSGSHEPVLNDLKTRHPKFLFLAVHSNADEPEASAVSHFASARLAMPILQDDHDALAKRFGALKTPHAFVINPKGEVVYQGGVTNSHSARSATKFYLDAALKDLEAGLKSPKEAKTRTLGCVIARSDK